jgi:hypothetical protein
MKIVCSVRTLVRIAVWAALLGAVAGIACVTSLQ